MDRRQVTFGLVLTLPLLGFQPKLSGGPVSYFEDHCARCHGDHGSNYDPQALKKLTEAQLRKYVRDMSMGPGNGPLEGLDLEAQVAYHRALIRKQPFVAVVSLEGGKVKGEAWGVKSLYARPGGSMKLTSDVFEIQAARGAVLAASPNGEALVRIGKDLFNQQKPLK